MQPFTIDIVSDVVCPWCFIGQRNLAAALETAAARFPERTFRVRWRPYQLDPTIPPGGVDRKAYLEKKFGGRTRDLHTRIARAGAAAGIPFRFDAITIAPNTFDAHRLLHEAGEREGEDPGVQTRLAVRLFEDFFLNGADIGDRAVLVAAARDCGLDSARAAELLAGEGASAVQAQIIEAQNRGVTGVPFFIFNGAAALSGAQPPDALARAIEKVATQT